MMLRTPRSWERGWIVAAACGLLTCAVHLADLGAAPPDDKPPIKEESKKDSEPRQKRDFTEALHKALEELPRDASPEVVRKALIKVLEQYRGDMPRFGAGGFGGPPGFPPPGMEGRPLGGRLGPHAGRLGIHGSPPSPILAEHLDLPRGQGFVVEHVLPDSPAAKAGLKERDILLELDGKPVPSEHHELLRRIEELKANTPVDAVVLRKGKKETIKGLTLPETKDARIPRFGEGLRAHGDKGVMTTLFRGGDRFTTRHQEGSLIITLTGATADGKGKVNEIHVQDGREANKYDSLDKVPERYRDKVKHLVDMSEKGSVKIEVK